MGLNCKKSLGKIESNADDTFYYKLPVVDPEWGRSFEERWKFTNVLLFDSSRTPFCWISPSFCNSVASTCPIVFVYKTCCNVGSMRFIELAERRWLLTKATLMSRSNFLRKPFRASRHEDFQQPAVSNYLTSKKPQSTTRIWITKSLLEWSLKLLL